MAAPTNIKPVIAAAIQALAELYKVGFVEQIIFQRYTPTNKKVKHVNKDGFSYNVCSQDVICEHLPESLLNITIRCLQDEANGRWEPDRAMIVKFGKGQLFDRRENPIVHWVAVEVFDEED